MPSQILPFSYLPPPKSPPLAKQAMYKPLIYDDYPSTTTTTVKPLLSRASTFNASALATNGGGGLTAWYHNKRRRSNSDNNCLSALPDRTNGTDGGDNGQQTIAQEVTHAAAETFLLTRLCLKLLSYLGYL